MATTVYAGPPSAIAWDPSGARLAVGCVDGRLLVRSASDPDDVIHVLVGQDGQVSDVAFDPTGERLASAGGDGSVRLWDPVYGKETSRLTGHAGPVNAVAFSPDGRQLATAGHDGTARLWHLATGKEVLQLSGHIGEVRGVAFSPDGELLATAGNDRTVRLWDPTTGTEIRSLSGHTGEVRGVAFSPDGELLASAGNDRMVRLWDPATGGEIRSLAGHSDEVRGVAFSPDGRRLASAGNDGTVRLWDPATGRQRHQLTGHQDLVWSARFSPDSSLVASASLDGTVRLWAAADGAAQLVLDGHTGPMAGVAVSPDGTRVASAGSDRTVRLWDPTTGHETHRLSGHDGSVSRVAFSPDGGLLASASNDRTVRLWDPSTGDQVRRLRGHNAPVRGVAFSPDSMRLASAGYDHTVRLWEAATGEQTHELAGHSAEVTGVAFSPDGAHLASASSDGTVGMWDATSGELIRRLAGHTGPVSRVAFSPDGTRLASAGNDHTIRLWDPSTGEQVGQLDGHTAGVVGVAYHPDGTRLASAGEDRTVRLWDAASGKQIQELVGHTAEVMGVAFFPDGTQLASASVDGTIRLWSREGVETARMPQSPAEGNHDRPISNLRQVTDRAAVEDLLDRSHLAGALAGQLIGLHDDDPGHSFAINVSGAWGAGKSSLVNLAVDALREHESGATWTLPPPDGYFDAWRQSQISPAWWSLLTWLRATMRAEVSRRHRDRRLGRLRAWVARLRFDLRELARRTRMAGVLWPSLAVVVILLLVVIGPPGSLLWWRTETGDHLGSLGDIVELTSAGIALLVIVYGIVTGASRLFTWRTLGGAKAFVRRDDNPMEDVIAHAQWLRARASGPVLLVVDDVDRCRAGFVVELLEAVQTLLRADDERAQPLITIVCADERWLHVAFEEAYQEFTPRLSRPGRTLGHLFLAKLFQLQVRVPALAPSDAVRFGRVKLGLPRRAGPTAGGSSPLPTDVAIHRIEATDSLNDKIRILDELSSSADDRDDAGEVRRAAVALGRTARSEETQRLLRHELEPFLELVESTPRAVVRFLNAYAIQRLASSTGQNQRPSSEELARWTILELRWPAVARRLIDDPELLDAWNRDGPAEDDDHAAALTSEPFRRVVVGGESTRPALDSAALRRCLCLPPRPPDVIDLSTPSPSPVGRHI